MFGIFEKGRFDSHKYSIKLVWFYRDDNSEPSELLTAKLRARHHVDLVMIEQLVKELQLSLLGSFSQKLTEIQPCKKATLKQSHNCWGIFKVSVYLCFVSCNANFFHRIHNLLVSITQQFQVPRKEDIV